MKLNLDAEKQKQNVAFNKIVKCIFSSKTNAHLESCEKLVEIYYYKFKLYDKYIYCYIDVLHDEINNYRKLING